MNLFRSSLILIAASCAAPVLADPAITFTGGQTTNGFPNRTFGYEFTTNSSITISALGFWDEGGDGLAESHEVGIWSGDGSTLLVSAVVPGGTAGVLDSGFRFVAITPFVLAGGQSFLAGAFNGELDSIIRFTVATTIPEVTLGSTRFDPLPYGSFQAPTETQGDFFDDGYFGPNFMVGLSAVPEPAAWALMIGGFALAGAALRRSSARICFA